MAADQPTDTHATTRTDTSVGSHAAHPPASAGQPAPRSIPMWLVVLPVLSIVLTGLSWLDTRRELATLSQAHQQLSADFDEARGFTTINVAGAPAKGAADQVLTLIEFSDYECPFCIRHFMQTMPEIEAKWIATGKLRYVFRDFPIDQLHPAAIRGHEATRCAAEQGKFWELHGRMFSPPGSHTPEAIEAAATSAALDMAAFRECVASGRSTADIQKTVQMAAALGANGTPAFFVGLRDVNTDDVRILTAVSGAQPFEAFEEAFEAVAARVK